MDPIFESYLSCFIEKEEEAGKGEYTIYITCKLSKTLHEQWKSLVTNLDEAEEVEDDPHCTFLWAKLEEDVDPDAVFEIVKDEVDGLGFELFPMGFKIFEDVNEGTQDCLVVKLSAPGDVTQIQAELKDKLISSGVQIIQDHPMWVPHMTIAYFPNESDIKYSRPQNGMLDAPIKATVDYMKINGGDEMEFNQE
jgi:2'-5' RNA ligase